MKTQEQESTRPGDTEASGRRGLVLSGLTAERASFPIIRDVTLEAKPGKVTVVLGANGAGKTTLLEAISGVIPITDGSIALGDEALEGKGRRHRSLLGLAHIEQGRKVFPELTTEENLEVGLRGDGALADAYSLFPELEERRGTAAGLLSGGEQQMLVTARALVSQPTVLMVDEMSLGLAPRVAKRLITSMRTLAEKGVGILLVEQFANLALETGDHAYVMAQGEIVYEGGCRQLIEEPEVLRKAYLGQR